MVSSSELWDVIEPVVRAESLTLFDIDVPTGASGVLRIIITRNNKSSNGSVPSAGESQNGHMENGSAEDQNAGIGVDDCALVSRRLAAHPTFEESLPERWLIEVSSPGINRRLRREEHYRDAVGERVQIKFSPREEQGSATVRGQLEKFDGGVLSVADEYSGREVGVPFSSIREARVDFRFDEPGRRRKG